MANKNNFEGKIKVPANLKDNKQNIIGQLDLRDIVYIIIAFTIGAGCFLLLVYNFGMNKYTSFIVAMVLSFPIGLSGFMKWDGLDFEDWIIIKKVNMFNTKTIRVNNNLNIYETYKKQIKKSDKNKKSDKKEETNKNKMKESIPKQKPLPKNNFKRLKKRKQKSEKELIYR